MKHEIRELLPFYANGTLDEPDRTRVEAELAMCAQCSAELDELRRLAATLRARAESAPPPPPDIFASALARIDAADTAPRAVDAQVSAASGPRPPRSRPRLPSWWTIPARYAAASLIVVTFGAAAAAAFEAYESAFVGSSPFGTGRAASGPDTVFRYTPNPARSAEAAATSGRAAAARRTLTLTTVRTRVAQHAIVRVRAADAQRTLNAARVTIRAEGGTFTPMTTTMPARPTSEAPQAPPSSEAQTAHAEPTPSSEALTMRAEVPASRLHTTLDELARLGTVEYRAVTADELESVIDDEQATLLALRAHETALRVRIARNAAADDRAGLAHELAAVRREIAVLEARTRSDLHRVAAATVTVTVENEPPTTTSNR
ncbi:MAG TPA: DUF4349 domain-containing protein [Candidatus Baltobacteraceae bacterium]|nr:DUF4349 domain-containing protein [Candidatus Baltobacteraceae bacterium]